MPHFADQTDIKTDDYAMTPSTTNTSQPDAVNRKKALGIAAATLLLGGAAWAITKKPGPTEPVIPGDPDSPNSLPTTELPADIDVAGKVTDTMSFDQAFKAAREEVGMGGVFGWHGHWYNTFEKEEWGSLSLEQRQQFTEMVTGEELPVKPYSPPTTAHAPESHKTAAAEPTIIEGHLNGQRVMGLDLDQDGVIDTLILDGEDGYTYRVVDAIGDDGLDTLFRYDSLSGELVQIQKIDEPIVLSNDQFSQGLEASMSKEVVDSIVEPENEMAHPIASVATSEDMDDSSTDDTAHLDDSHETDDTYVNDGDVHDMED